MEEEKNRSDLLGNVVRPPSLRVSSSLKATLSGRLTPRSSPSFRRSQSSRTPRKDVRFYTSPLQWIRGRRLLPWLVIIGVWSYLGFHIQSKWAHGGDNEGFSGFESIVDADQDLRSHVLVKGQTVSDRLKKTEPRNMQSLRFHSSHSQNSERGNADGEALSTLKKPGLELKSPVSLKKWFWKGNPGLIREKVENQMQNESSEAFQKTDRVKISGSSSNSSTDQKDNVGHIAQSLPNRTSHENAGIRNRGGIMVKGNNMMSKNTIIETRDTDARVTRNTSFGVLVGPFDKIENRVLGWNAGKRYGTCNRKGLFAHAVRGRSFIVVLHELSMTGAPLAMMELAAEILSCGGRVSAIALSKKGGLMEELVRRGIKVLKDKAVPSYRVAMKTDIVIVGSAVSASWIEHYLVYNRRGAERLVWWIMENRREYFDRSKYMLHKVKALLFLSEVQSQQWSTWSAEEGIKLPSTLEVVPLSVNDELAFVAGLQTALNSPLFSVEKMLEKRKALRGEVRKSMGLDSNDMLVMTLSSINPGKGQLILLKAALMIADETFLSNMDPAIAGSNETSGGAFDSQDSIVETNRISRILFESSNVNNRANDDAKNSNAIRTFWNEANLQNASFISTSPNRTYSSNKGIIPRVHRIRQLTADMQENETQKLKVLIGSVGSKSNKVPYIKNMLRSVAYHPKLASVMLWTPATIHVAPLYAAADVYVINAQGIGETFGRVTIEAMAFGLPVLGTAAGGTREIVEDNVTGLLHPVGQKGIQILSQHIRFLLDNESTRVEMGRKGREKVEKLFLKHHMYDRIARILQNCMSYT